MEKTVELSKVEIITNMAKVEALIPQLGRFGVSGMTVLDALGCGVQFGAKEYEPEKAEVPKLLQKKVVMAVLPTEQVDKFLDFVEKELYTGHIGDGKIFISPVTNVVRVRTGEEGCDALYEGKAY